MILHILFSYDCILCHLNLNLVSFVMFLRKYPRKIGRNPIRNSTAALSFVWFPPSPPPSPSPTSECRKQNKIQQKRHHIKLLTWMVYAIAATVYVITWLYGQLTAVAFRFLTITGEMKSIRCSMQRFPSVCVCVCVSVCVCICVCLCVYLSAVRNGSRRFHPSAFRLIPFRIWRCRIRGVGYRATKFVSVFPTDWSSHQTRGRA